MSFPSHTHPPRLCHLKKWDTYSGYGFNLHAEKGKAGQYIGKVDPDSPADLGGLKTKDYLIEVNGVNVEDLTHQKVVEKVKERSDIVTILVVDMDVYKNCKDSGIVIRSDMPEVVVHTTPDRQPTSTTSGADLHHQEIQQQAQPPQQSSPTAALAQSQNKPAHSSGAGMTTNGTAVNSQHSNKDPLGNISLEEMRAKIGKNRRTQVKMNPSSFSEKHNMFQAL